MIGVCASSVSAADYNTLHYKITNSPLSVNNIGDKYYSSNDTAKVTFIFRDLNGKCLKTSEIEVNSAASPNEYTVGDITAPSNNGLMTVLHYTGVSIRGSDGILHPQLIEFPRNPTGETWLYVYDDQNPLNEGVWSVTKGSNPLNYGGLEHFDIAYNGGTMHKIKW